MEPIGNVISQSEYFIIAEIGMNHDGSYGNALRLIEEAKNAGVNAVKFQLHISEEESLINAPKPPYFKNEERYEYFQRTSFTMKEWKRLKDYTHSNQLYFIVSPFSHKAVDLLEDIKIDAYKIASGETTNLPLLEYIDSKNKPILLSTGMSNWNEINNAINAIRGNILVLFQCSSQYPCLPENVGLNIIKQMKREYNNIIIGYSDHTLNNVSSIGAFISGARVFEKHFTLSKKMYGADARFSFEPDELINYVKAIEGISRMKQCPVDKDNLEIYRDMKKVFEKSIVASTDLEKGRTLTLNDLNFKKPGDGIRADQYKQIIGKVINKSMKKDDKIKTEDLIY